MFVKICGLSSELGLAEASCADAVGFVFAPSSRQVSPAVAQTVARQLPDTVKRVAVFHRASESEIAEVCSVFSADWIQVEPGPAIPKGKRLLPVFHSHSEVFSEIEQWVKEHPGDPVLLESSGRGGRGVKADWSVAARLVQEGVKLILAGGLNADNLHEAFASVRPFGVDVSSGVELSKGIKDPGRIRDFITTARSVGRQ